jgi:hypothetical protein
MTASLRFCLCQAAVLIGMFGDREVNDSAAVTGEWHDVT